VDTSAEAAVATDALGRRSGPRRQHTIEEKLRIVQETHVRGASVATVARHHNLNPNQVFAWRQLYRRGLLDPKAPRESPRLLPVRINTPTVVPRQATERGKRSESCGGLIEIELANGHRIHVHAGVGAQLLRRVIAVLVRQ
jgi:transposase